MEMIYIGLVIFLLSVFLISVLNSTRTEKLKDNQLAINYLDNQLKAKQEELQSIDNNIKNQTIDNTVALRNIEVSVLNIYDESNIRIPVDIIEELSSMNLETEKEIFNYIENQRNYWKLENTKKPYRKG